jgi:hypothetical protein
VELEEILTCVNKVMGERATEAGQLSQLAVGIFNALFDLEMLLIWDIP